MKQNIVMCGIGYAFHGEKYIDDIMSAMYQTLDFNSGMPKPVEKGYKSKEQYRYSYEPFLLYHSGEKATSSAYHDRMMQWDWDKFHDCCEQVWGNRGQLFYDYIRKAPEIEKFLQLYFDKPQLELCWIQEECNVSNGYAVWSFGWKEDGEEE